MSEPAPSDSGVWLMANGKLYWGPDFKAEDNLTAHMKLHDAMYDPKNPHARTDQGKVEGGGTVKAGVIGRSSLYNNPKFCQGMNGLDIFEDSYALLQEERMQLKAQTPDTPCSDAHFAAAKRLWQERITLSWTGFTHGRG